MRSTLLGTSNLIESIYKSNQDGLGLMYINKRGLKIVKVLPKTVDDFRNVIINMPDDDRQMALHARMQTHGEIDTLNCHPYVVAEGRVALMHNGILATGNDKDTTRSDTWHFVEDFLSGPVSRYPDLIHDKQFLAMLGEMIDNNRFVFMDNQGQLAIVNKEHGVTHKNLWFANTYAWDASLLIKGYTKRYNLGPWRGGSWYTSWDGFDGDAYDDWKRDRNAGPSWGPNREAAFLQAVVRGEVDEVSDCLEDFTSDALDALYSQHLVCESKYCDDLAGHLKTIGEALVTQNLPELKSQCKIRPDAVAEVLCYYVDVVDLSQIEDADDGPEPEVPELSISHYRRHCITVAADGDGWGFVVEGPNEDVLHAGTGGHTKKAAREEAMRWIDANCTEEA